MASRILSMASIASFPVLYQHNVIQPSLFDMTSIVQPSTFTPPRQDSRLALFGLRTRRSSDSFPAASLSSRRSSDRFSLLARTSSFSTSGYPSPSSLNQRQNNTEYYTIRPPPAQVARNEGAGIPFRKSPPVFQILIPFFSAASEPCSQPACFPEPPASRRFPPHCPARLPPASRPALPPP